MLVNKQPLVFICVSIKEISETFTLKEGFEKPDILLNIKVREILKPQLISDK